MYPARSDNVSHVSTSDITCFGDATATTLCLTQWPRSAQGHLSAAFMVNQQLSSHQKRWWFTCEVAPVVLLKFTFLRETVYNR